MHVIPFATFPGRKADPRFSPDGNQLVFSWNGEKEDNWDIYIKQIGEEKPLRLTSDPRLDRFQQPMTGQSAMLESCHDPARAKCFHACFGPAHAG